MKLFTVCLSLSVLLAGVAVQAAPASAGNSCLTRVSNGELVSELSRRLSSGPVPPAAGVDVSALCNGSTLKVEVWSPSTNTSSEASANVSYSTDCARYRDVINRKARELSDGGRVAACNGSVLVTFMIGTNGSIKTTSQEMSYSTDCQNQANIINQ